MRTEKELNSDILKITVTIKQKFSELSKYIKEMPVKISYKTAPKISVTNLMDCYNSLNTLLVNYTKAHASTTK